MLTIVIPTLNEEEFLPLVMRQIKKQDFKDYEVIIADAGSKDKTISIARSWGCRIVKGGNVAHGRNAGAKSAKGDLILFMDADNIYLPDNFLTELVGQFEEKNLDIAVFPIYLDGNKVDKAVYKAYNRWVKLFQRFKAYATNSMIVRKKVFNKIGGFDEKITLAEDHDFAKRAAKKGKFGFIDAGTVLTSCRRVQREGRMKIYSKYALAAVYIELFGPIRKDIFRYWKSPASKNKSK